MFSMDIFNIKKEEIQEYYLRGIPSRATLSFYECFDPYLRNQKVGHTLISGFPQDDHLHAQAGGPGNGGPRRYPYLPDLLRPARDRPDQHDSGHRHPAAAPDKNRLPVP